MEKVWSARRQVRIGRQDGLRKDLVVVGNFGAAIGLFGGRRHDDWTGARGICLMVHHWRHMAGCFKTGFRPK
jgi:hypothetical protein